MLPRFAFVAVVLWYCVLVALAAPDAEFGPELGTWQMKQDNNADAPPITLTLLRREGDEFVGVIEFFPDGPHLLLETFTARVDPARRTVRFEGRDRFSKDERPPPATYEADLAADGRTLTRFRNITLNSSGVTNTVRWQKSEPPTYDPAVMASLALRPSNRTRFASR